MADLRIPLRKIRFIDSLVEEFKKVKKTLNASIFSFIILNLVKKGILGFLSCSTVTDNCMKELIDSSLHRAL